MGVAEGVTVTPLGAVGVGELTGPLSVAVGVDGSGDGVNVGPGVSEGGGNEGVREGGSVGPETVISTNQG